MVIYVNGTNHTFPFRIWFTGIGVGIEVEQEFRTIGKKKVEREVRTLSFKWPRFAN